MNKLTEKQIQDQVIELLLFRGWLVIRLNSGVRQEKGRWISFYRIFPGSLTAGLPDIIALKGTQFRLYEVKRPGEKMSESQMKLRKLAERYGIYVTVISDCEEVLP